MANKGKDTNTSQFLITLKACPELNGKNVVFGQIISGIEVLDEMGKIPSDEDNKPVVDIKVFACGTFDETREHLEDDVLQDLLDKMIVERKNKEKIREMKYDEAVEFKKNKISSVFDTINAYESDKEESKSSEKEESEDEASEEVLDTSKLPTKLGKSVLERIKALKKKANEARAVNREAVEDENKNKLIPSIHRQKANEEYKNNKKAFEDKLSKQGISREKAYLTEDLSVVEKKKSKLLKKKRARELSSQVVNQDSLYRTQDKKVSNTVFDERLYEDQIREGEDTRVRQDKAELLSKMFTKDPKKKKFSRPRLFLDEKDKNYINENNRIFNEKAARFFEKEAAEIKANLERGGAL